MFHTNDLQKSTVYFLKSNMLVKVSNSSTHSRLTYISCDRNFQNGDLHEGHFDFFKLFCFPYFKSDCHEVFIKLNCSSSSTISSCSIYEEVKGII